MIHIVPVSGQQAAMINAAKANTGKRASAGMSRGPGTQPQQVEEGLVFIPEIGEAIRLSRVYQNAYYDTLVVYGLDLSANNNGQNNFFQGVSAKPRQHTNFLQDRKIPNQYGFNLLRCGLHLRQQFNNVPLVLKNALSVYEETSFKFELNEGNLLTEGPTLRYQSGYGVTGALTADSASTAGTNVLGPIDGAGYSLPTLGVPSLASAPSYYAAQAINDRHDLIASNRWSSPSWIVQATNSAVAAATAPQLFTPNLVAPTAASTAVGLTLFLDGIVVRPLQ